ncbi:MAG TPA: hypothetical protein VGH03_17815 [Caulobacteraceae bacterium]|jgi:hypothetical protein
MSRAGAAAGGTIASAGETASSVFEEIGHGPFADLVADGALATASVSMVGSTPSGEGEVVVLFIDAQRDPLEIDAAGDPLLVQAGQSWIGRSASEVV